LSWTKPHPDPLHKNGEGGPHPDPLHKNGEGGPHPDPLHKNGEGGIQKPERKKIVDSSKDSLRRNSPSPHSGEGRGEVA